MPENRPFVLSIAGLDPSGGAGLLADAKTFEMHRTYGFGVCSGFTVQNDTVFRKVNWLETGQIIEQLEPLVSKFPIKACKIGIVQNLEVLREVLGFLKEKLPEIQIVWDPVLKASTRFSFQDKLPEKQLVEVLKMIHLLTPNFEELQQLKPDLLPAEAAAFLAQYCAVLLKGGHNPAAPGTDFLYEKHSVLALEPGSATVFPKHGSGCVLSAAIAANLALGHQLPEACRQGKRYTETVLTSNSTLLGYHNL